MKANKFGSSCVPMAIAHGHPIGRIQRNQGSTFGSMVENSLEREANEVEITMIKGRSEIVKILVTSGSLILALALNHSTIDTASAAQTSSNFEQEWSKLSAAAKQEGTLSIASGGAPSRQYRPVVDVFSKKFGVKVEVSTGNATDTVNRVLAERKAGRYIMKRDQIKSYNGRIIGTELFIPDLPRLAELYGAKGVAVTKKEQLKPAFQDALSRDEFVVVDVKLD